MVNLPRSMHRERQALSELRLGRVQLRIMRVLWPAGQATAREITDALCRQKAIAHSTVQTLLRKLEDKGAVTHAIQDRTFVFRPLVTEQEARRSGTRDLIARLFDGDATGLVSYLLKEERLSAKDLRRLLQLAEGKEDERAR